MEGGEDGKLENETGIGKRKQEKKGKWKLELRQIQTVFGNWKREKSNSDW